MPSDWNNEPDDSGQNPESRPRRSQPDADDDDAPPIVSKEYQPGKRQLPESVRRRQTRQSKRVEPTPEPAKKGKPAKKEKSSKKEQPAPQPQGRRKPGNRATSKKAIKALLESTQSRIKSLKQFDELHGTRPTWQSIGQSVFYCLLAAVLVGFLVNLSFQIGLFEQHTAREIKLHGKFRTLDKWMTIDLKSNPNRLSLLDRRESTTTTAQTIAVQGSLQDIIDLVPGHMRKQTIFFTKNGDTDIVDDKGRIFYEPNALEWRVIDQMHWYARFAETEFKEKRSYPERDAEWLKANPDFSYENPFTHAMTSANLTPHGGSFEPKLTDIVQSGRVFEMEKLAAPGEIHGLCFDRIRFYLRGYDAKGNMLTGSKPGSVFCVELKDGKNVTDEYRDAPPAVAPKTETGSSAPVTTTETPGSTTSKPVTATSKPATTTNKPATAADKSGTTPPKPTTTTDKSNKTSDEPDTVSDETDTTSEDSEKAPEKPKEEDESKSVERTDCRYVVVTENPSLAANFGSLVATVPIILVALTILSLAGIVVQTVREQRRWHFILLAVICMLLIVAWCFIGLKG